MTIRAPSFLSRSRPSSPVPIRPDQVSPNDGDAPNSVLPTRRPLSRLQNPFKRAASASPSPAVRSPFVNGLTPLEPASSLPGGGAQYLDSIGLRFAEAASKALANPVGPIVADAVPTTPTPVVSNDPCAQMLKGRKPFPPGRGATLGSLITSELGRTGDIHLSRAIIRTLQRPLSVMLNNLSTMLMPILPYVTLSGESASSAPTSFVAQAHALGIARLAAELLEALNGINAGAFQGVGGVDPLRGIRDGLEVLVQRVVSPLIGNVKVELGPILDMLATQPSADGESSTPSALPSLTAALPGITTRLEWYTSPPGSVSQSAHAALLIALVWRALAALASRPLSDPFVSMLPGSMKKPSSREGMKEGTGKERLTPPGLKAKKELPFVTALSHISSSRSTISHTPSNSTSTSSGSTLLNGVPASGGVAAVTAAASASAVATPPRTPPVTPRFGRIALPTISRPPSPNSSAAPSSKPKGPSAPLGLSPLQRLLADTTAVQALLNGLSKPPKGGLAFEAVDEAFEALEGFKGFLSWLVEESNGVDGVAKSLPEMVEVLVEKSEDVPALIALGVLLQLVPPSQLPRSSTPDSSQLFSAMMIPEWRALSISELVHIPSTEYRTNCLAGFGRADAAVEPVGRAVLDAIAARRPPSPPRSTSSSSASTFLTVSASVPFSVAPPALLSAEKGLDVRVLRAWLAERIITNDDDKEPSVVPSLDHDAGLRENLHLNMDADVPAVDAVIGRGGGEATRLA